MADHDKDPLDKARGFLLGIAVSLAFWMAVVLAGIYWWP